MLEILDDAPSAGSVIAGAYRLEQVLGEGGMGIVWAARELRTNRVVALKLLKAGREADPRNQQRLLREARAAMGIHHRNIARVEAVLETEAGVPFMVMELLHGESLRARLDRQGMLSAGECARTMVQVVDAVAAAHASGVIHRDLKPENVFMVNGWEVRVLDFGIAKTISTAGETISASLTATGVLLGTPVYMAPEQIYGDRDIDARADVWSLGIMLYECLAARRPTDGDGLGPILKRITTGDFPPLEVVRQGLPGRITRLVGRMLTRDRNARPTLGEIREVLDSVARMGDEAVPSAHAPFALAPMRPVSTTGGIENRRDTVDPYRTTQAPAPSRAGLIAVVIATVLVLGGGAVVAAVVLWPGGIPGRTASTGADGGNGPASVELMRVATEASKAIERRDGATCLRDVNAYDANPTRPTPPSTDPTSSYAIMRATCMALLGDCENAKKLYASAYALQAASFKPTPLVTLQATDSFAASFCEGDKLSARDALLRADTKLTAAGGGIRKATPAECRDWYSTEKRLLPSVKPRDSQDTVLMAVAPHLESEAAMCLAYAGDCAESFRIFRADFLATAVRPLPGADVRALDAANESSMRQTYAGRVAATPCRGKP